MKESNPFRIMPAAPPFITCLKRLNLAILVLCIFLPMLAQATIFDWDAAYAVSPATAGTPTAGNSVTKTYNSDTVHAGNDVSITLANEVGTWSGNRPVVDKNYNGGTTQNSLAVGFSSETSTTQGLTITINFSAYTKGVRNVSFQIFDVDYTAGTWIDQIDQIWGVTATGAIIGASIVTGAADNAVTGSGTGFVVTGKTANSLNTSAGNVSIDFGSAVVTQVSFRWKNIDAAKGDQKIGLGDITYFDASPEVGSSLGAMIVCGLALGFYKLRSGAS